METRPPFRLMCHWTRLGLAQLARLSGDWLMRLPQPFTARQAMGIGTAGYTAMLGVIALERHGITPDSGNILVTGACGGVGSFALALLSKLGYRVIASTGRIDESDYLRSLGATEVIDRATLSAPGNPISSARWAGAIDCVGSHTLANACAGLGYRGVAVACGMAQGLDFPASVAPFILRGVTLVGIDSVHAPMAERDYAWQRLGSDLDARRVDQLVTGISLGEVIARCGVLLDGRLRGRLAVDLAA